MTSSQVKPSTGDPPKLHFTASHLTTVRDHHLISAVGATLTIHQPREKGVLKTIIRIAVLMASHNRCQQTLDCIQSLYASRPTNTNISVFLTDDASQDDTPRRVKDQFKDVTVLKGDGNLFWCKSMARSWEAASEQDFDAYLWVNDDVLLHRGALESMIDTWRSLDSTTSGLLIVSGSLLDPVTGEHFYGVSSRPRTWHPRFKGSELLRPNATLPTEAFSFHGNLVLIPRKVAELVGRIDSRYLHGMGDTDYAFRAQRLGVRVFSPPGYMGTCPSNPNSASTLKDLLDRKNTPWRDWLYFTKSYSHPLVWPAAFLSPYIGAILRQVGLRRHRVPLT